ncbi:MAG: sulfite exporter TauE/SafE family protein [Leptospiraceae bacterium]|jgi:sulfite exporter TauE/SafE|nr:sulfite exporter TauE/SafE family protein [Leptospiraceae bacterium]
MEFVDVESYYLVALISGFLGGLSHCSFMCGPIITSFVVEKHQPKYSIYLAQFFYHSGRIFTYSMIGFLMGYGGFFVSNLGLIIGIKNTIMILVGIYLILKGLEMVGLIKHLNLSFETIGNTTKLFSNMILFLRDMSSSWKYFLYGLILGFLPCGLSYTAFIASSGLNDPFKGFLFMFLFGLANVPALFFVVSFSYRVVQTTRSILYYLTAIVFIVSGIYFIYSQVHRFF